MANDHTPPLTQLHIVETWRSRAINWAIGIIAAVIAAIGARWGIEVPPPPPSTVDPTPPPTEPPQTPPHEPAPNPLGAIVRIGSGNVGCSATIIGPRRPDGRYWVLTAAHCVSGNGQRWSMRFRNGATGGFTIVNFDRQADWAWGATDSSTEVYPYALLADATPPVGTALWHAGYGVDVPGNREDGQLLAVADANGQIRMRMSVSSGDSGGGVVLDGAGRIVSTVCCTTRRGAIADVWGASPERCRAGQRDAVSLDDWRALEIPVRPVPKEMPAKE